MVAHPSPPSSDPGVDPAEVTTSPTNLITRKVNGKVYQFPPNKPLYSAHGKWAWANGYEIVSGDKGTRLGDGLEGHVNLKVGMINETAVVYISKMTSVWDSFKMFFSSLYLNASHLRPLQGDCVPWIIGVRHCQGGRIGVAQDLPHPTGWREADMFLEESQKEAIIAAYQKLHDQGVLHGDVEYRHMLIGDDGKVTIIDFGFSNVLNPDEWALKAGLDGCSKLSLLNEMRKVKFMLDWKDSRETELRLANLRNAREERDRANRDAVLEAQTDPFKTVAVPKEPMSEEERKYPQGGFRRHELEQWSYGDRWVAHRFEVDCGAYSAKLKKTPVPRPPIPAQKATESKNIITSVVPGTAEPIPISADLPVIQLPSTVPAGTTDTPTLTVPSLAKCLLEVGAEKKLEKEQENLNTEHMKEVLLIHGKADKNDMPVRKHPLEDEQGQELLKNHAERKMDAPMRDGKAGDSDGPVRKRPLEVEPKKEPGQKEQKNINAEGRETIPVKHNEAGESGVPGKKRPFEDEPEKKAKDMMTPRMAGLLRHGKADLSRKPGSLDVGPERMPQGQNNTNVNRTKAVLLRQGKSDDSKPARKRQRTTEASDPILKPFRTKSNMKQPLVSVESQSDDSGMDDSINSDDSSESDAADDAMRFPLIDDDAADPTPYELNPEACAFLRGEAVRGLARFTTAKTRVLPLEKQFNRVNHDLEKSRSELLRIMLMLPIEDRTTLWTNMGQPDARTLLGLLPETPRPRKPNRNLVMFQNGTIATLPSREPDPGFLAVQRARAKTGSKQKLHERLEIEQKIDRLAMPPPPPPPLPVVIYQKSACETIETSEASSATLNTPPTARSSQRIASQEGGPSQSSPSTLPGPTHSGSTTAAQSVVTPHIYYEGIRKALAEPQKANPQKANPNDVFSVSVPNDMLAMEGKSTPEYTISDGPSSLPSGNRLVRSLAMSHSLEDMRLESIKASKQSGAKRKRKGDVSDSESDDSKLMPIGVEGLPDAKRRKTKNCSPL